MECPAGTIEVSFWFPTLTEGVIYFDSEHDSHNVGQCVGIIYPEDGVGLGVFEQIIAAVKPVLDLMTPKRKMETDYYTLTPEEFESLTEGIHHEVPERDQEE